MVGKFSFWCIAMRQIFSQFFDKNCRRYLQKSCFANVASMLQWQLKGWKTQTNLKNRNLNFPLKKIKIKKWRNLWPKKQWRSSYNYMVVWPYLWRSVKMTVIAHDRIEKYGNDRHLTVIFVSIDPVKKWRSLNISRNDVPSYAKKFE